MRDVPIPTPGGPVSPSLSGGEWRRRGLRIGLLVGAFGALLALGGFSWRFGRPPAPPGAAAAPSPLEASLHRRLRLALVRIAPEGGDGGSGTLLDREARLVATTTSAVGDRPEARVLFPPDPAAPGAAAEPAVAARVVYRDAVRRVALLRLDRVPGWALPLPLGERPAFAPGRPLLSVRPSDAAGPVPAEKPSWADTRAEVAQVYQPPHHCSEGYLTPWMVSMREPGLFCDAGAPVLDEQGVCVAIGGPREGDASLTRLVDAAVLRAVLEEWSRQ